MIKICECCGKEFIASSNTRIYCSRECSRECNREKKKDLIYGVGINDYPHPIKVNGKHFNFYKVWRCMFSRTIKKYSPNHEAAYKDVYVCEEWHYLNNFKKWYDEHYIEGNVLDKDICSDGTRCYSPNNCAFVPQALNNLLSGWKYKPTKSGLPRSIEKINNKYFAYVHNEGKGYYTTRRDTMEEAIKDRNELKLKFIKQQAQKYYDLGKIEKRVYDALMNYKFEI